MIKSLFDHDDEEPQPKENKSETETEESIRRQLEEISLAAETPGAADDNTQTITQIRQIDPEESFAEAVEDAEDDEIETVILPRIEQVHGNQSEPQQQPPTTTVNDVSSDNQFYDEEETVIRPAETAPIPPHAAEQLSDETAAEPQPPLLFSTPSKYRNVLQNEAPSPTGESFSQTAENAARPEARSLTTAETIRQSGMAWSAAIGLFGSVLFMMILGWFFDLLTGASPFGIVLGIIIGAGIGFYQFFRITSQIFKK